MSQNRPLCAGCLLVVLAVWLSTATTARGQDALPGTLQAVSPVGGQGIPLSTSPVRLEANFASRFDDGNESALLLTGNCKLSFEQKTYTAPLMVIWQLSPQDSPHRRLLVYLESSVEFDAVELSDSHREQRPYFLVDIQTTGKLEFPGRKPAELKNQQSNPSYLTAKQRRLENSNAVQLTQYSIETAQLGNGFLPAPETNRIRQHVTINPRFLGERLEGNAEVYEGSIPPEYVITLTGGVNIVIDNVPLNLNGQTILSRVDLSADRAVVWTDANKVQKFGSFDIDSDTPLQVYLEGNIIVRQGNGDVRASHAFYDINQHRGLAMNAELRTLLPDLQGTLRLRAGEVRQLSENKYHAKDAFFTTSEFGSPKYRVQASDVFLEEQFFGTQGRIDPVTGQPEGGTFVATSLNNTLYFENIPVFTAPYLTGLAEDPKIPVRAFNVGFSSMYGTTVETAWDLRTILGLDLDPNVDLQAQADYLSKRGPGAGLRSLFDVDSSLFGAPVHHTGWGTLNYINDHGLDNLGLGRRTLPVYNDNRGQIIFRDRITVNENTWIQAEIGDVFNNDRNFREQYYESGWDTDKDLQNLLVLNHQVDNFTGTIEGTIQSDQFNDETNWLPKGDATILGQQVFNTPLIWSSHSSIGYGQLNPAEAPPDPTLDPFQSLPYFANVEGTVAMTRHELNMPFDVGPIHVVPYAMGELAYWEEDLSGNSLGRAYGTAGVKASIEFAKYMPNVHSSILGLNGLAHKVVFDAEYYYADSSTSIDNIAQYNQFDDNSQERFRERLVPVELGGAPLPAYMDPRYYAIRSGDARSVTSPTNELVDAQNTIWLGMRHRLQTKVGPAEDSRIVDWMEFDLGTAIFPNADRDNFGETLGLINSRYVWHVSPRTSFIADGVWDVFEGGQKVWNAGVLHQRSARGSMYVGFRQVEVGPIESQLVTGSFSYVLSPNLYMMTASAQYDVSEGMDRGESVTITRIGEFFLLHMGLGYDRSRNNVGVAVSLEPKFGSYGSSSMQLNSLLGIY